MGLKELRETELALAREFIAQGVPVFVAKPVPRGWNGRSEFFFPAGWPYLDPDESLLDEWKPGWAVCAVTGIKFDVMDIDPRNGGDTTLQVLKINNIMPPIRGAISTPSGGTHYYMNRTGLRKSNPWTGVDIQAGDEGGNGRGFVYIPPTIRKRRKYKLEEPIDWDALAQRDPAFNPFFKTLLKYYEPAQAELDSIHPPIERELSVAQRIEVIERMAYIASIVREARPGNRDTFLNKYSYTIGGLISGSRLDESLAIETLKQATYDWEISNSERTDWAYPKIIRGIEQGKQFPIFMFGPDVDLDLE